jgi:hypothetical protein
MTITVECQDLPPYSIPSLNLYNKESGSRFLLVVNF